MSSLRDRFQRAARDGYLDVLKDATRKDCNQTDEDGMTPTLWAAFSGNLDALRTLVGRGGDLGKCDLHGNTALHWAAANGHINCVSFLVNFGINLWALDNDYRTGKDVAAINNREEVVQFLDQAIAKQSALNTKTVQKLKEKAITEADKRVKLHQKQQKKAAKRVEKEEKQIEKERRKLVGDSVILKNQTISGHSSQSGDSRTCRTALKFSDIVNANGSGTTNKIKILGGVSKKVLMKKQQSDSLSNDFKVRDILGDDGTRSIKSLTGIRRDNEILYVPKFESSVQNKIDLINGNNRLHMKDVFGEQINGQTLLHRSISEPDFLANTSNLGQCSESIIPESSIFERPGFGSVAFRGHFTSDLLFCHDNKSEFSDPSSSDQDDSIGSAGSFAQRNNSHQPWGGSVDDDNSKFVSVLLFLYANGLSEYVNVFKKEKIDLDALMLLNDDDLKSLGLPLGPRRKILLSIHNRRTALESPGDVRDTKL